LRVGKLLRSLALAAALLSGAGGAGAAPVVVSSKLSSESALIGHMIRLLLEANGIPTVDRMTLAGTPIMRRAIIAGMVDVYVEYTGNAGFFFNVASDPAWKDLGQGYVLGARLDYAAHRIVWLTPANASNAWALAVRSDVAAPAGLRTMTDFGRWVSAGGRVVLACSAEFANSATLKSLERTYGFTLRPEQLIVLAGGDTSATIRAAAERTSGTNTAMVYGTDGAIVAAKLEVLDDDRHDQPIYAPVPIIREATLKAHPEIATIVRPLMESFDRATLTELNARIQINGEPPVSVAEDYLRSRGLLGVAPAAPLPRRVGGQ
jgi:osmoprotectant transport system substrate-binding protein